MANLSLLRQLLVAYVPHLDPFFDVVPMSVVSDEEWSKLVPDNAPTAAVNPERMVFADSFLSKLSQPKQLGLMLHEILHMYRGDLTYPWIDPTIPLATFHKMRNIAQDLVLEGYIANIAHEIYTQGNTKKKMEPDMWPIQPNLKPEEYRPHMGKGWVEVYWELKARVMQQTSACEGETQTGKGKGKSQGENRGVDATGSMGGDSDEDKEQQAQARAEFERAIARARNEAESIIRNRGNAKGEGQLVITPEAPRIPWQTVLRNCLQVIPDKNRKTWSTIKRRDFCAFNRYTPGRTGTIKALDELSLLIDTSGSMHTTLGAVAGDVLSLFHTLGANKVHIIYYDVGVLQHDTINKEQLKTYTIRSMPAGGGTAVAPALDEIVTAKGYKPHPFVALTDGYDDYKVPTKTAARIPNMFWISYGKRVRASFGMSIEV